LYGKSGFRAVSEMSEHRSVVSLAPSPIDIGDV
jgi:hypothetical protein